MRASILMTLVCPVLCACAADIQSVRHPVIDRYEDSRLVGSATKVIPGLEQIQQRLLHTRRTIEIGTLHGAPETVLARPSEIAVTPRGEILILDASASEVRVFDERGSYIRTLATKGGGPAEVRNPIGIDLLSAFDSAGHRGEDRLVVGTRSLVRVFDVTPTGIVPRWTYRPPDIPTPSDVCVGRGRIVVRSAFVHGTAVVAAFTPENPAVLSFGNGYQHGGPIAQEDLSLGPTACAPNGDVIVGFTNLPLVTAYDSTGTIRWSATLPDFKPLDFRETRQDDGRQSFARLYNAPGDMVLSLHSMPNGAVLVQVARLSASTPEHPYMQRIEARRTYLISGTSGRGSFVTDSLPEILAVTDSSLWC